MRSHIYKVAAFVAIAAAGVTCSVGRRITAPPQISAKARLVPYRSVEVHNTGLSAWRQAKLTVYPTPGYFGEYSAELSALAAGATARIPLHDFRSDLGVRLDAVRPEAQLTIAVDRSTWSGPLVVQ